VGEVVEDVGGVLCVVPDGFLHEDGELEAGVGEIFGFHEFCLDLVDAFSTECELFDLFIYFIIEVVGGGFGGVDAFLYLLSIRCFLLRLHITKLPHNQPDLILPRRRLRTCMPRKLLYPRLYLL
jgi:hypothetical protein